MKYWVLKHWKTNTTKIFCKHQKKIVLFDSYEKSREWLKSWNGYGIQDRHTYPEQIELFKITPKYILNPLLRSME